jgi:hypothetical protein
MTNKFKATDIEKAELTFVSEHFEMEGQRRIWKSEFEMAIKSKSPLSRGSLESCCSQAP